MTAGRLALRHTPYPRQRLVSRRSCWRCVWLWLWMRPWLWMRLCVNVVVCLWLVGMAVHVVVCVDWCHCSRDQCKCLTRHTTHVQCRGAHTGVVRLLILCGALPDPVSSCGDTALHFATRTAAKLLQQARHGQGSDASPKAAHEVRAGTAYLVLCPQLTRLPGDV